MLSDKVERAREEGWRSDASRRWAARVGASNARNAPATAASLFGMPAGAAAGPSGETGEGSGTGAGAVSMSMSDGPADLAAVPGLASVSMDLNQARIHPSLSQGTASQSTLIETSTSGAPAAAAMAMGPPSTIHVASNGRPVAHSQPGSFGSFAAPASGDPYSGPGLHLDPTAEDLDPDSAAGSTLRVMMPEDLQALARWLIPNGKKEGQLLVSIR